MSKGTDYLVDYKSKPNGVYFIISNYSCTACLASLVNDINIKLNNEIILNEIYFYSDSEFEYKKYKNLFNADTKFIKSDSNKSIHSKYIIKKDNYIYVKELNQHLDSREIINKAKMLLTFISESINRNELIFSINHLTSLNDSVSFFTDEYNGNVFTYNSLSNQIILMDYKLDSLKNYYLDINSKKLPNVWPNGHTSTTDHYLELSKRMNNLHRINSFSKDDNKMELIFSLITHNELFIDSSNNNIPSLNAKYTTFIFNFNTNELRKSELNYLQYTFYYENEYSFYSSKNGWVFGQSINDTSEKEIFKTNSYLVSLNLTESIIFLKKDSVIQFIPKLDSLKLFDLVLNRNDQLFPVKNEINALYSVSDDNDFINITKFNFNSSLTESKLIINKSIIGDEKYLGILDITEEKQITKITLLTERQKIITLQLSKDEVIGD